MTLENDMTTDAREEALRAGDMALVPKEPTRLMTEAAEKEYLLGNSAAAQIYRAMLAARPVVAAPQEPVAYITEDTLANLLDETWKAQRNLPAHAWTTNNPPSRAIIPLYTAPQPQAPSSDDVRDAARWRWIEPHFRVFSPHMDGNHHWCATGPIGRITGPTFGAAVDATMKKETK